MFFLFIKAQNLSENRVRKVEEKGPVHTCSSSTPTTAGSWAPLRRKLGGELMASTAVRDSCLGWGLLPSGSGGCCRAGRGAAAERVWGLLPSGSERCCRAGRGAAAERVWVLLPSGSEGCCRVSLSAGFSLVAPSRPGSEHLASSIFPGIWAYFGRKGCFACPSLLLSFSF